MWNIAELLLKTDVNFLLVLTGEQTTHSGLLRQDPFPAQGTWLHWVALHAVPDQVLTHRANGRPWHKRGISETPRSVRVHYCFVLCEKRCSNNGCMHMALAQMKALRNTVFCMCTLMFRAMWKEALKHWMCVDGLGTKERSLKHCVLYVEITVSCHVKSGPQTVNACGWPWRKWRLSALWIHMCTLLLRALWEEALTEWMCVDSLGINGGSLKYCVVYTQVWTLLFYAW